MMSMVLSQRKLNLVYFAWNDAVDFLTLESLNVQSLMEVEIVLFTLFIRSIQLEHVSTNGLLSSNCRLHRMLKLLSEASDSHQIKTMMIMTLNIRKSNVKFT